MKFLKKVVVDFLLAVANIVGACVEVGLYLMVPLLYLTMALIPIGAILGLIPKVWLWIEVILIVGTKVLAKWIKFRKEK